MNFKNILVYDSGIGGLSVLALLDRKLNNKNIMYYGDNFNAPYGSINEYRLKSLVGDNILKLPYKIDLIVLACNTASLSVRSDIEKRFNVKTMGVFPCVENELMFGRKTLLLGTPLTVSKIKNYPNLMKIGLKNLAFDIERKIFNLKSLDLESHFNHDDNFSIKKLKNQSFDSIILGCTHYHFIKNLIINHFQPPRILSGNYITLNQIIKFYKIDKSLEKIKQNQILFLGENAKFNKEVFYYFYKKI